MTAKHTKQKYTEKQTRLGAKVDKEICEEIRTDTKTAKARARPFSKRAQRATPYTKAEDAGLIQEFVPFHKNKKKKFHKKKK